MQHNAFLSPLSRLGGEKKVIIDRIKEIANYQKISKKLAAAAGGKDAIGSPYVYIVNSENTLDKVAISVIGIEGNYICVRGELPSGSKVVKAGVHSLHKGQKVKIIKTNSPTNKGGLI